MKIYYKIEVDCANCANTIEEVIKKTSGIISANINFMTQKLIIEFEENIDHTKIMQEILKKCKKIEPDFKIEL